jgi:hypothetical protein
MQRSHIEYEQLLGKAVMNVLQATEQLMWLDRPCFGVIGNLLHVSIFS